MPPDASQPPSVIRATLANLATLASGELLARGLTFLAFTQLARVLSPSGFGLLESVLAIMMFCMLFVDQGFGVYGTREIARRPGAENELIRDVVSAQLVIASVVVAGLWAIPPSLHSDPEASRLLGLFGLSLLGIPFLLKWVFQGWNEMFWFAAPAALRQLIFLVLAVTLVRERDDLLRLPFAEITAVAVTAVCYVVLLRRRGRRLSFRLTAVVDRALMREAAPIGASHLLWAFRMYVPVLFVNAILTTADAGLFGAGHRVFMVFQSLLAVYFTNLLPAISQATVRSRDDFRRLLWRSLHLVFWPTLLLLGLVFVAAPFILGLIYGHAFATAASSRNFLVLTTMVPVLAWRLMSHSALIATNRQRVELVCSVLGALTLVAVALPFIRTFGLVGAAYAMLAAELVTTVVGWLALVSVLRPADSPELG